VGLFDNCFSMKGTAEEDGVLKLTLDGQASPRR